MNLLLLLSFILFPGLEAKSLTYDYSSSIECLEHPQKPQYGGGIIKNPELNNGLKSWTVFGSARIEHRELRGNHFIVSHSRNNPYDSASQKIFLRKNRLYALSAWIQVNEGDVTVRVVFKTLNGFKHAGATTAKSNCWSMLKGGFTADSSGPAELYFESNNTSVEIWADSISIQPFTYKQWRSHQYQSIEKTRKKRVLVQAVDEQGNSLPNATISIEQKIPNFPFGSAINKNILNNEAYQNWFTSRFTVATFENEMKWYSTERNQGQEDYSTADSMLKFAKQHNIAVRGHNVFWDNARYQPGWVPSLPPDQLNSAVEKRLSSVVSRYKDQLIAWDVVNENMHFRFLESKLGNNASARIYNEVHKIDGETTLFLNEFNTIEDSRDGSSTPAKYIKKIREIQSYSNYCGFTIGIGLESHFSTLNLPYMRAAIDTLAATGLPIWLTELDVTSQPKQAEYLEEILREAYSHPKVEGIVMWTGWSPQGCYRMCLTDNNFKNLPTGDVVDKLLQEWRASEFAAGKTDPNGFFEASLSHGHYQVKVTHPVLNNSTSVLWVDSVSLQPFTKTEWRSHQDYNIERVTN
ncbi:endo-1,4-beta-xylanase 5-like isoform X3 [Neltuma alba]|uniref:endo-1,4-beta-xylanase 5-like isoform X3 n=1 Tax=Neltuma alba TaxID=207710 RepID=UPI0010A59AA0|nr:endo-1,4-beta-xylanase 5-like isoform X3 [Prosopis alba]